MHVPTHTTAHTLHTLQEAEATLTDLISAASLSFELAALSEAALLLGMLRDGGIVPGVKLSMLPNIRPPLVTATSVALAATSSPASASPKKDVAVQTDAQHADHGANSTCTSMSSEGSKSSSFGSGLRRGTLVSEGTPSPPAHPAASLQPAADLQQGLGGRGNSNAAATASACAPAVHAVEPMHRLLAASNPSAAVGVAVRMVNEGKCREAEAMLDLLLMNSRAGEDGGLVGAYATRGTARALLGKLRGVRGVWCA
jgi:hypothetical protein